jgi:DNA-binding protein YbaB
MVVAAFRGAQDKVKEMASSTMGSFTGGMSIPGLG